MTISRVTTHLTSVLAAAIAPCLILAAGAVLAAPDGAYWPQQQSSMATAITIALVLGTALAILAAAVSGAAGVSALFALELGAAFVVMSGVVLWAALGFPSDMAPRLGLSHLVLASAITGAFGIGRLSAAMCRHPLDAAALAALTVAGVGGATMAVGPNLGVLTPAAVNALLAASPVFAVTSAADIDLFHSPALYRLSPIAHQQFGYPAWYVPPILYVGVAILAWLNAARLQKGFR